ncbi:MAG TPA: diguanylate cyclase, partial [Kineosporiaceae bacterium]|nr:diguanylate cyclase [Kineosporiaceae bacterium]
LPAAVGEIDGRGRLVRANAAMGRLLGAGEVIGYDLHNVGWPAADERAGVVTVLDTFLAGEKVDGVFAVRLPPGEVVDLQVRCIPRHVEHEPAGGVVVLVDVTSRVAEQRAVAVQGEAYRLLAEHLGDVVLISEDEVIWWASPSMRQLMGHDPDSVVGRTLPEFVHPDDMTDLVVSPSAPTMSLRGRLLCADGAYRWFDTNVTARFGPDGAVAAVYVCARDVGAQVRAEQLLQASEQRMREALDASPDGFAVYQVERDASRSVTGMCLLFINAAGAAGFTRVFGNHAAASDATDLLGRDLLDFYPEGSSNGLWQVMVTAAETGQPQRHRIETVEPSWTGVTDGVHVRLDANTVLSTWRDVTDLLRGERLLSTAHDDAAEVRATLQTALDATSDGFAVFDLERDDAGRVTGLRTVHANVAATSPVDRTPEQVLGRDPRDWFPLFKQEGVWDQILASVAERRPRHLRVHLSDQTGGWTASWDNTVAPVGTDRIVLTWRDVTTDENARRYQEDVRRRAEHDATHDALTGLPNRVLLRRRLMDALSACPRGELVGVVYCDLDDFKQVNDRFGHAVGDAVLKATAQRLRRVLRSHDTAARLAGDEFVLVLRYLPSGWDAAEFRARTAERLTQPVGVEGLRLECSASLGIVLADPNDGPDGERDVDALLAAADEAMYRSKTAGQGPARSNGDPARDAGPESKGM